MCCVFRDLQSQKARPEYNRDSTENKKTIKDTNVIILAIILSLIIDLQCLHVQVLSIFILSTHLPM